MTAGAFDPAVLVSGLGRNRWQVTQIVVFAAVRDGFQVLRITPVGDTNSGKLPLLCHIHSLLLLHNGVIGKLVSGDPATLFYQAGNPLRIGICLGNLIQCVPDKIAVFHDALPLSEVVFMA